MGGWSGRWGEGHGAQSFYLKVCVPSSITSVEWILRLHVPVSPYSYCPAGRPFYLSGLLLLQLPCIYGHQYELTLPPLSLSLYSCMMAKLLCFCSLLIFLVNNSGLPFGFYALL